MQREEEKSHNYPPPLATQSSESKKNKVSAHLMAKQVLGHEVTALFQLPPVVSLGAAQKKQALEGPHIRATWDSSTVIKHNNIYREPPIREPKAFSVTSNIASF